MDTTIDNRFYTKIEQFQQLKPKDKLYFVSGTDIRGFYFAGFNPMSENMVMFVDSHDHTKIHSIYWPQLVGKNVTKCLVRDYEFAKEVMLKNAVNEVETIKKIYFKDSITS